MRRIPLPRAGQPAPQRGSVMIEALVSIVVTSMALLASAALAINAAKVNQSGRYRAQAILLANDIVERLNANADAAATGAYALDELDASLPEGAPDCRLEKCAAETLAATDLAAWSGRVLAELPQATASLVFTPASGTAPARYTVNLQWVERALGHGGTTRTNAGDVNTTEPFAYTATAAIRPPRN